MNLIELINKENTAIIDVRTKVEFSLARCEESINIPLDEIPNKIIDLKQFESIVLCCAAGVRSEKAVQFLKYNGFDNVYNGGSWKDVVYMKESYEN